MRIGIPVEAKIYVAGHDSVIGAVVCRKLEELGYWNIITRNAEDLDLRNQVAVQAFFEQELPDYVFLATLTGEHILDGLLRPAESLYSKTMTAFNVIHASYLFEVRKLLSIIDYQFGAEALKYETNEPAVQGYQQENLETDQLMRSMVAGLCDRYRQQYSCDFISVVFHVNPAQGSGGGVVFTPLTGTATDEPLLIDGGPPGEQPRPAEPAPPQRAAAPWQREQLYADDPAHACLFLMENFSSTGPITIRTGARRPDRAQ